MTRESLVHASREDLIDLVVSSNERLEALEQQLRWFKQQLFGRKSERQIPELDPAQLCLGEPLVPQTEPEIATTTVRSYARRKHPEPEAIKQLFFCKSGRAGVLTRRPGSGKPFLFPTPR